MGKGTEARGWQGGGRGRHVRGKMVTMAQAGKLPRCLNIGMACMKARPMQTVGSADAPRG